MDGFRVGVALVVWAMGAFGCGDVEGSGPDAPTDAAEDAAIDAAVDAAPDTAPPAARYDVGYVDSFTLPPTITSLFGFVAVVNMGTAPLKLSTASVVTYLDDNPGIDWGFAKDTSSTAMLAPGRAGGFLTLLAKTKVLANGVVVEPVDDEVLRFSMSFTNLSAGTTLQAQAVIAIEDVNVTLPITVNVVAGASVEFNSARRVSSP